MITNENLRQKIKADPEIKPEIKLWFLEGKSKKIVARSYFESMSYLGLGIVVSEVIE